jgi:putative peptidoglycan lipid II flippase
VQSFFRFLSKEINGLHQAAFLLAFAAIGAKILALLRDRLLASSFGAGKTLDIYYASFRIPDFLYVFSLFLVSATALIPIFLEKKSATLNSSESKSGRSFINGVFTIYFILICLVVLLTFFLIPILAPLVAPGFSLADNEFLIKLSRILLLSPLLLGLSNLLSGVIQSFKRFLVYALSGILYNVGIILGLVVFYPVLGLSGVVWGVVLGAFFHLLIQIPSLLRLGYFPRFTSKINWRDIKKVIHLSFPRTLGLTVNQLVLTVITALASFLAAGSIAVFNLSINLQAIPLGVVALSYSVAAFPDLARKYLRKEKEEFFAAVLTASKHLFFWLMPITVLFIVLRAQIVRVILGAGAFTWADTRLTAASLALLSISLFAQGFILLLVRAFYAAGKTREPLFINVISSLFIVLVSLLFLNFFKSSEACRLFFQKLLRVEGVPGTSVLALPLAYSFGTILNFLLLVLFFEKDFGGILKAAKKSATQILIVSFVVGLISYTCLGLLDEIFDIKTFVGIFMQGLMSGIAGLFGGFLMLKVLKNKELIEITLALRKKFSRKRILATEPEELP